jgi:hypothetical protein
LGTCIKSATNCEAILCHQAQATPQRKVVSNRHRISKHYISHSSNAEISRDNCRSVYLHSTCTWDIQEADELSASAATDRSADADVSVTGTQRQVIREAGAADHPSTNRNITA